MFIFSSTGIEWVTSVVKKLKWRLTDKHISDASITTDYLLLVNPKCIKLHQIDSTDLTGGKCEEAGLSPAYTHPARVNTKANADSVFTGIQT